ncbi:EthD domain-containing protein [Gordonia sp. CPCC 206044]|uniref:EthD domain-containing protein n=1 Tax=Gordonia sp. CPCC 206044 TaxID=3140793 RepID=UPI003AF35B1F
MFKAFAMIKRKPGTSLDHLKQYYEANHVPLAIKSTPGLKRYIRRYLHTYETDAWRSGNEPPFDVITEIWFENRAAFDAGMAYLQSDRVAEAIAEDEEKVFDRQSIIFVTVDDHETDPAVLTAAWPA